MESTNSDIEHRNPNSDGDISKPISEPNTDGNKNLDSSASLSNQNVKPGLLNSSKWIRYLDGTSQKYYYYNTTTLCTVWDKPEHFDGDIGSESIEEVVEQSKWMRYLDGTSQKYYYYNTTTLCTVWDKPEDFNERNTVTGPPAVYYGATATYPGGGFIASSDYSSKASFNVKQGTCSCYGPDGTMDYWSSVGRPSDRSGRQLAHYFDVSELEANRAEYQAKKRGQHSISMGHDFKRQKAEKKIQKQKEWLRKEI